MASSESVWQRLKYFKLASRMRSANATEMVSLGLSHVGISGSCGWVFGANGEVMKMMMKVMKMKMVMKMKKRRAERHHHVEEQELVHDADEGMSHMLKMKSAIMAMLHRSWWRAMYSSGQASKLWMATWSWACAMTSFGCCDCSKQVPIKW